MELTRRHLAAAGVLALGASTLIRPALADAGDEGAVKEATELLRKALLAQDKAKLEALIAEQVSYGHSDGRVQDKAEFVDGTMTRKATVKSLEFPELKVAIVGNAAIARHLWLSESELDGKPTNTKIGVLAVWQKQDGSWRVVARQGYKLA
jgi:ketosteroid isomerase-like protein